MNRLWLILWCSVLLLLQESQQLGLRLSRRKEACCYFALNGIYPQHIPLYSPEELNFHRIWKLSDKGIRYTCFPFLREKLARIYRPRNLDKERYYRMRDFFYKTQSYRRWSGCRRSNIFGEYFPRENVLLPINSQENIKTIPPVVGRFIPTSPGYQESFLNTQETEAAADSMEITIGYDETSKSSSEDSSTPYKESSERPMYSDIFYIPSKETMKEEPNLYFHEDKVNKKKVLVDFVERFGGVSEPSVENTSSKETTTEPTTTESEDATKTTISEETTEATTEQVNYRIYEDLGGQNQEITTSEETMTPEPYDRNPWYALTEGPEIESHSQINKELHNSGSSMIQGSDEKYSYLNDSGSVEESDEAMTTTPIEITTTTYAPESEILDESVEILDDAEEKLYEDTYIGKTGEYQNEDDVETTTTKPYYRSQDQKDDMGVKYPYYSEYDDETVDETTVKDDEEEDIEVTTTDLGTDYPQPQTTEGNQEKITDTYEQEKRIVEELPIYDDEYTINEDFEERSGIPEDHSKEDTTKEHTGSPSILGYNEDHFGKTVEHNEATTTDSYDKIEVTEQPTTEVYDQETTSKVDDTTDDTTIHNDIYGPIEDIIGITENVGYPISRNDNQDDQYLEEVTPTEETKFPLTLGATYEDSSEIMNKVEMTTDDTYVNDIKDNEKHEQEMTTTTTETPFMTTIENDESTSDDNEITATERYDNDNEFAYTESQQSTTIEYKHDTTRTGYEELEDRIGITEDRRYEIDLENINESYNNFEVFTTEGAESPELTTTESNEPDGETSYTEPLEIRQPTTEENEQETTTEEVIGKTYSEELLHEIGKSDESRYKTDAEDNNGNYKQSGEITTTEGTKNTSKVILGSEYVNGYEISTEINEAIATEDIDQSGTTEHVHETTSEEDRTEHNTYEQLQNRIEIHEDSRYETDKEDNIEDNKRYEDVTTTEGTENPTKVILGSVYEFGTSTEDVHQSTTTEHVQETTTEEDTTGSNTYEDEELQDQIEIHEDSRYETDIKDNNEDYKRSEDVTTTEGTENPSTKVILGSVYEDHYGISTEDIHQSTTTEQVQETTTDEDITGSNMYEEFEDRIRIQEDRYEIDEKNEELTTTEKIENESTNEDHYRHTTEYENVSTTKMDSTETQQPTTERYEQKTTEDVTDMTNDNTKYEEIEDRIAISKVSNNDYDGHFEEATTKTNETPSSSLISTTIKDYLGAINEDNEDTQEVTQQSTTEEDKEETTTTEEYTKPNINYGDIEDRIGSEEEDKYHLTEGASLEDYGFSKEETTTEDVAGNSRIPEDNYGSMSEEARERATTLWEDEIPIKEQLDTTTKIDLETNPTQSTPNYTVSTEASTTEEYKESSSTTSIPYHSTMEGRVVSRIRGRKLPAKPLRSPPTSPPESPPTKPSTKPPGSLLGVVKPVVREVSSRLGL